MGRPTLLFAIAILAGATRRATPDADPAPPSRIDALVAEAGIGADGPGVGVLVVTKKGVEVRKCYGLRDLDKRMPITPSTTFELASVSKQFTGAAVLLLVQRGKVRVEDDVRQHLPAIPPYDPKHPIRVDHLSRHTSGLPDYLAWRGEPATKRPWYGNGDAVAEFARRKTTSPLEFTPGERYDYSNSGYMVLAALVERVSGASFGTFLSKEIFGPFGMTTAWVHESPRVPTSASAIGYTRGDDGWEPTWSAPTAERHEDLLTCGDGGVWASLDDLAAWDRGLRGGKVLHSKTLLGALKPGTTRDGERVAYAFGWELSYGEDGAVVGMSHSGSWQGFQTYLGHDVVREVTVVVLSNRGGFEAEEFGEAVGALFRE